mmetsp:Transcript_104138/g.247849  ORF Transcript_104138/g.247849 Transcript_104138/m.247849 type:complete len:260 (+) Transcript_104138:622-1401(+)
MLPLTTALALPIDPMRFSRQDVGDHGAHAGSRLSQHLLDAAPDLLQLSINRVGLRRDQPTRAISATGHVLFQSLECNQHLRQELYPELWVVHLHSECSGTSDLPLRGRLRRCPGLSLLCRGRILLELLQQLRHRPVEVLPVLGLLEELLSNLKRLLQGPETCVVVVPKVRIMAQTAELLLGRTVAVRPGLSCSFCRSRLRLRLIRLLLCRRRHHLRHRAGLANIQRIWKSLHVDVQVVHSVKVLSSSLLIVGNGLVVQG